MWAEGVQDQCVTRELNTLLTALYVLIDDHVVEARVGRGRRPLLSDSELITLAVAQMLQGYHCERRWIRHLHSSTQWRAMFPYLPRRETEFSVLPLLMAVAVATRTELALPALLF